MSKHEFVSLDRNKVAILLLRAAEYLEDEDRRYLERSVASCAAFRGSVTDVQIVEASCVESPRDILNCLASYGVWCDLCMRFGGATSKLPDSWIPVEEWRLRGV